MSMIKPFLVGENVYLRPFERDDLEGNYKDWVNDAKNTQFTSVGTFPLTEDELTEYYESNQDTSSILFAIVEKTLGKHIGNARLYGIDWVARTASRGILLSSAYWGEGYGSETISLLSDYAFQTLNLNKLKSCTVTENEGIKRVNEKAGYKLEGTLRQEFYRAGRYYDMYTWGLTKNDYLQGK